MRRMVGALAVVVLLLGVGGDATARGVPMSHAAYDYLESALTLLQDKALDRYTVDWRKIRGDAFEMARDASEPADTYSAIRGAIATIGNRHTRLIPPGEAVPPPAARIPVPEGELLYGRSHRSRSPVSRRIRLVKSGMCRRGRRRSGHWTRQHRAGGWSI